MGLEAAAQRTRDRPQVSRSKGLPQHLTVPCVVLLVLERSM